MKTISLGVSESDYAAFREASRREGRPIAQLIREAMAHYRERRLERRRPLHEVPGVPGHRLVAELPSREEIWGEIFAGRSEG